MAVMSSAPTLPTLIDPESTFEISSWPWYITCERPTYLGAAGAAAVSVLLESQAERPTASKKPATRITLRIGILPVLIARGCAASRARGKAYAVSRPAAARAGLG